MNRVAIAFSTKDRVELSRQSIAPLLQPDKFDAFWIDGSNTEEGLAFPLEEGRPVKQIIGNVRGGADAAIVFSLTTMLNHPDHYTHIGLVENDVLLHKDWFGPTMALFERGEAEGLHVGAVSARCYEDRVLFQRDGYAVCHNLGAGMVIFTRKAAELVLFYFRTGWWGDNRRVFAQLSGLDIGRWGAFRFNEQFVTADWHFDAVLASHGLASLALTPSPCEMIGQVPPLHEQGLKLVAQPVEMLRNDKAFEKFATATWKIWYGSLQIGHSNGMPFHFAPESYWTVFPHQIASLAGEYAGPWKLKWMQGFGPFAWKAGDALDYPFYETKPYSSEPQEQMPTLTVPISGPCSIMVSGGEKGGKVEVEDLHSGYKVSPELPAEGPSTQILNLPVPAAGHREIRLTMLTPGTMFYGLQTREPQAWLPRVVFNHSMLPPV